MKKVILCILILCTYYSYSQTKNRDSTSGFRLIDSVFKNGEFFYEVNELEYPSDVQIISAKFNKSMTTNKAWFEQYFNKYYKEGEGLPYNEKFGITKEEYNKIKNLENEPPKPKPVSLQKINLIKKEGMLTFSGEGDFKLFDFLVIDLKAGRIRFGDEILTYSSEINAPATTPFGSWHGYSWKYEKSNQSEKLEIDNLTSKVILLNIGKTIDNKILFRVKYQEADNGKSKANMDIIGFIK